jgi:outer membrane protein assembly factor BamB
VTRLSRLFAVAIVAACLLTACGGGAGAKGAQQLGSVRWRWRPPPPADLGMPAADIDGAVVTVSHVFIVSLAPDGTERWRARRLGVREETPLLTPDLVVVPADDGLAAFDRATGAVRWDTHLGGNVHAPDPDDAASTPVQGGSTILTCLARGALVGLDAGSGAVRWRVPLAGRSEGPPATDGRTATATWDPKRGDGAGIGAFDVANGARRWTAPLRAGAVSAPALVHTDNGHALTVAVDHDLAAKAFDVDDGGKVWATGVGGGGSPEVPPLALGHGQTLVADRVGGLTLLDAHGGRQWSTRVDAAAVRGGPVGPAGNGLYALPLYSGRLLVAGPRHPSSVVDAPGGLVSGVAVSPNGTVLVSSAQGSDVQLVSYRP